MTKIIELFKPNKIAIVLFSLGLAACGGKSAIISKDNSADYQNVQALPPLKKPKVNSAVNIADPAQGQSNISSALEYRIIEESEKHAWLEIDAGFDDAWEFLGKQLGRSDLTIHHRNKAAAMVAIGCGSNSEAELSEKRSRLAFFKRKQLATEYCALRLSGKKNNTKVKAFDRNGSEFDSASARSVFARLLNKEAKEG